MNKSGGISGVITWILCVGAALIVLCAVVFAGYLFLSFDTQYAPGYSASAFNSIKIGDTEQKVFTALGNSFATNSSEPYVQWVYSANKQPEFSSSGEAVGTHTLVRFGTNGHVTHITGQVQNSANSWSFGPGLNSLNLSEAQIEKLKGQTPEEIKKQFGEPVAVYEYKATKLLRYSRSPSSSNYHLRLVGLDGGGKVVHIWREVYWD